MKNIRSPIKMADFSLSPDQRPSGRKLFLQLLLLIVIGFVGFSLRGLYLAEIKGNPDFSHPAIDASYHDYWARGLVKGEWTAPEGRDNPRVYHYPFYRPPGYAYFLALIYRVFGFGFLYPRVVQMVVGMGSSFLAFFLGRRWFSWVVGELFAFLMATYWIFIYFEGELVGVVLAVFLGLVCLFLLSWWGERMNWKRSLINGIALGIFVLVRPNVLLFCPVAFGWMIWVAKRRGRRSSFGSASGLLLGVMMAIAPAGIRNYVVSGEFVPLTTNAGISLRVANNQFSDGTTHAIPELGDETGPGEIGTPFDYPRIVDHLSRKLGRTLRHSEASHYLTEQALRFVRDHPGKFLRLLGRKALLFWGPREIRNLKEVHFARKYSPVLNSIPLNFPLIFSLALLGTAGLLIDIRKGKEGGREVLLSPQQGEVAVLVWLYLGVYFLSLLPFAAAARYRTPVIPFLLLLGAIGLKRIGEFGIRKDWYRCISWGGIGVLLYLLAAVNYSGYEPAPEKWHHDLARAYTARGDWDEAVREYRKAIALRPGYAEAYSNLGLAWQKAGELEWAIESYRKALAIKPSARTHKNLADALLRQGKAEEGMRHYREALRMEPDHAQIRCDLANALSDQGKIEEAIAQYRETLRIQPDYPKAHNNLGNILYRQNDLVGAIGHFEEAIRSSPSYFLAHYNLANALALQGKLERAALHYREALRIKPDYSDARNNLGAVLAQLGRLGEAVMEYERVLKIDPGSAAAYYNLGVVLTRLGQNERALDSFRRAVEIRPDYEPAWRGLAAARQKGDRD